MRKLLLSAALSVSALSSMAQISPTTGITDLALIYIGSQHRPDWNKELFYPYVVHEYADGTKSWMYDGFVMVEFAKWNDQDVFVSFGEANAPGSQKKDWLDLLDEQLGTKTGLGCKALDELIGEQIPVIGRPGRKHQVVLTLPIAEQKSGNTWGEINGRQLNFSVVEDRTVAEKWYVDLIVEKWEAAGFKNLDLAGIYWVKEAFPDYIHPMVKEVNEHVHTKGLHVFWIPYFDAPSWDAWDELGVDQACLQPNYYGSTDFPMSKLETAINNAWEENLGIEVEFEGYNYSWDPATHERKKYILRNSGMYDNSPLFQQRLVDYIDKFEEGEVFTYMPIAYYTGFQGVYDFMTSGHPKDHEVMDRLALLINQRHVGEGCDTAPHKAGIDEITNGNIDTAYAVEGGIYISDKAGKAVSVSTVDGRVIYTRSTGGERYAYGEVVECQRGVYVVSVGTDVVKIAVK